jgi:DNA mismatch endonuclease (patch repair protein)
VLEGIGVEFREQVVDLPGNPDFYLPGFHTVVLTHGCFWHGHACANARPPRPATARADKIVKTTQRDPVVIARLTRLGLRVLVIWECAISGPRALPENDLRERCVDFLTGPRTVAEISGSENHSTP